MLRTAPARPLLPQHCEVCRCWAARGLCADCAARYAAPRPRCGRCALATGVALEACGHCLRESPAFDRTVCVADYTFPWDQLITAFKFHGRAELAGLLAEQLAAAIERAAPLAPEPRPACVVPVPLSPQRLRERGYNQAWELARRVARRLALPADAELLHRPLDTAHQSGLSRGERQRNLRNAFTLDPQRRSLVQGQRIALVDDVMTTGATVQEAASALRRAGAAAVEVWVLARTPDNPGSEP